MGIGERDDCGPETKNALHRGRGRDSESPIPGSAYRLNPREADATTVYRLAICTLPPSPRCESLVSLFHRAPGDLSFAAFLADVGTLVSASSSTVSGGIQDWIVLQLQTSHHFFDNMLSIRKFEHRREGLNYG